MKQLGDFEFSNISRLLLVLALFGIALAFLPGAQALTEVDACGALVGSDMFILNTSLADNQSNGRCIDLSSAVDAVFDCDGFSITGSDVADTYGVYATGTSNITVKNCIISDYERGLYFVSTSGSFAMDNTFDSNEFGVYAGSGTDSNSYTNNMILNSGDTGVYLSSSTNNIVANNTINDSVQTGVYMGGLGDNNQIIDNVMHRNVLYGVYSDVNQANISNNLINQSAYGVYLTGSGSNLIQGNTIREGQTLLGQAGIYLLNSPSNQILSNTISDNSENGIYLNDSTDNLIESNTISGNDENGIYIVSGSTSNEVFSNSITGNAQRGIYIGDVVAESSDTSIYNNTIDSNEGGGIYSNSNRTSITFNGITNNGDCGSGVYLLGLTENNTVGSNMINNNNECGSEAGVYLENIKTSNVTNNTINGNYYGLYLTSNSDFNIIANNTINGNAWTGVYVGTSGDDNSFTSNNITNNNGDGGVYDNSNANIYTNNRITGNVGSGIWVDGCCGGGGDTDIISNIIANNTDDGIYLSSTSNVDVISNNLTNNTVGVYLETATTSNLTGNRILDHVNNGLYLVSNADSNHFEGNLINNTLDGTGVYLGSSATDNNFISNTVRFSDSNGFYDDRGGNFYTFNTVSDNDNAGFYVDGAGSGNLYGSNTLERNYYGFYISFSDGHTLTNNSATLSTGGSSSAGLYLDDSDSNSVEENDFSSNNGYGMYIYFSDLNDFDDNDANSNSIDGVYFSNSNDNVFSGNANENGEDGIYLVSSMSNLITTSNFLENGDNGLGLTDSDQNTITFNFMNDNGITGIYLGGSSDDNLFGSNEASRNGEDGIDIDSSMDNVVTGNTLEDNGNLDLAINPGTEFQCDNEITGNTGTGDLDIIYSNETDAFLVGGDTIAAEVALIILCDADSPTTTVANVTVGGSGNNGILVFFTDFAELVNVISVNNTLGLLLQSSTEIDVTNSVLEGDTDFSTVNSESVVATNVTLGTASVRTDFTYSGDFDVSELEALPEEPPSTLADIGRNLDITGAGEFNITMHYSDTDLSGVLESTLELWRNNGSWARVPNAVVNTTANTASANLTEFSAFALLAQVEEEGGGGGGGAGGGAPPAPGTTVTVSPEAIEGGSQQELSVGDTVTFTLNGESHSGKVLQIGPDYVVIEFSSTPFRETIKVGETKLVDLDFDGIFDLSVFLEKIVSGKAFLTYTSIRPQAEAVPPAVEGPTGEIVGPPAEAPAPVPGPAADNTLMIVVVALIVIAIVIGAWWYKKQQEELGY